MTRPCADMAKAVKVYSVDENRFIRKIRIVSLSTQVRKFRVNPVEMRFLHLIYAQKLNLRTKNTEDGNS